MPCCISQSFKYKIIISLCNILKNEYYSLFITYRYLYNKYITLVLKNTQKANTSITDTYISLYLQKYKATILIHILSIN